MVDYNSIRQILVQRRRDAQEALRRREEEIKAVLPEIFIKRRQLRSAMAQAARKALSGAEPVDFSKEIEELNRWEREQLTEKGYPADYLELKPFCPLCSDTGYVGEPVQTPCRCHRQLIVDALCRASHMANLDRENFDTFDPSCIPDIPIPGKDITQREHLLQIRDQLMAYTDAFPHNDKTLVLLFGHTGLGKTFLLNCMGKALLDRGHTVVRVSAFTLAEWFVQSMFDKENAAMSLSTLAEVDALIIDDLGTEVIRQNSTLELLYHLVNQRLHDGKHIFLSTNLSLIELQKRYFERFTSRLFGNQSLILEFVGKDIRLYNK